MKAQQTFEQLLVTHCSPTLAGLKIASLFSLDYQGETQLFSLLASWRERLEENGLTLEILRKRGGKALIYVYWRNCLNVLLKEDRIREILAACGYHGFSEGAALAELKGRIAGEECFPHEIGLFLGYPLHDVMGFIKNRGKNCCMCGYWKVYGNEYQARQTFEAYTRCRNLYQQMLQSGVSVMQLIGRAA